MDNARFEALAAELAAETTTVNVKLEAARAYFDVLGKQNVALLAAGALEARRRRGTEVDRFMNAARITAVEQLAYGLDLVELEGAALGGEAQRKAAAANLAILIGKPALADAVHVSGHPGALVCRGGIPPLDRFVETALRARGEPRLIGDEIAALERQSGHTTRFGFDSVVAGYSYVGNKTGLAQAGNGFLGGNTGRGELTLNIPLRNTGDRAARERVMEVRGRILNLERSAMENTLQSELIALHNSALFTSERARLAGRKLELARKAVEVIRSRAENGLSPITEAWSAEQALLAAESAYTHAEHERKAALYALFVASGMEKGSPELAATSEMYECR